MKTFTYKLTITFHLRQKNDGVYNPTKIYYSKNPEYITDLLLRFNYKIRKDSYFGDIAKVEMTSEYVSISDIQKFQKENGWVNISNMKASAEIVVFYEMLDYGNNSTASQFVNKTALKYSRKVFFKLHQKNTVKRFWYTKFLAKRLPSSFKCRLGLFGKHDIKELREWAKSFVDAENLRKANIEKTREEIKAERLASAN